MADTNVAQDQIKAYVDRILRMKDEADAIAADIKEIYAEAKGNGFDKTQLGNVVTYLRKKDKDADKVAEGEAIFDLYLSVYMDASGKVGTKRATHAHASEAKPKADPLATLRADPALAIVSPADIAPKTNSQPVAPQAESDLTVSSSRGQVAPHPVANVEEDANGAIAVASDDPASREVDDADRQQLAASGFSGDVEGGSSVLPYKYPAPGIVVWESTPPEGVERHPYSQAFGDLGQDIHVISDDIAMAKAEPIVKIGNVILDGWARYMVARGAVGLDGQSTEYQVVQYDGTDPLLDCIRWNIAGRILSDKDKQTVVARLVAIEPKRKADIIKAVAEMAI
jgi:uncharacterized protein (UPF0335 family)